MNTLQLLQDNGIGQATWSYPTTATPPTPQLTWFSVTKSPCQTLNALPQQTITFRDASQLMQTSTIHAFNHSGLITIHAQDQGDLKRQYQHLVVHLIHTLCQDKTFHHPNDQAQPYFHLAIPLQSAEGYISISIHRDQQSSFEQHIRSYPSTD